MVPRHELKSVKKALKVLSFLNQDGAAITSQVAKAVSLPRSTVHRILETLTTEGLLTKSHRSDYYRLTGSVRQLASGYQGRTVLVDLAAPYVADLGRRIGWSVSLLTPRGADMVIQLTTNHETSLVLERYMVGLQVPMMHSTAGFCYLAHCSPVERERLLDMCRRSADPLQNIARNDTLVRDLISSVWQRGFSQLEFKQYREGNIAVPLTAGGVPYGGLVMRYMKSALKLPELQSRYVPILLQTAAAIMRDFESNTGQPWIAAMTVSQAEPYTATSGQVH
jgi:IclR family mhp operon transcriptional activator